MYGLISNLNAQMGNMARIAGLVTALGATAPLAGCPQQEEQDPVQFDFRDHKIPIIFHEVERKWDPELADIPWDPCDSRNRVTTYLAANRSSCNQFLAETNHYLTNPYLDDSVRSLYISRSWVKLERHVRFDPMSHEKCTALRAVLSKAEKEIPARFEKGPDVREGDNRYLEFAFMSLMLTLLIMFTPTDWMPSDEESAAEISAFSQQLRKIGYGGIIGGTLGLSLILFTLYAKSIHTSYSPLPNSYCGPAAQESQDTPVDQDIRVKPQD